MPITVTPIATQSITAWRISTQTAPDLVLALSTVAYYGWRGDAVCTQDLVTGGPTWQLTLSKSSNPTMIINVGDWIVWDGVHVNTFTNDMFIARYTANVNIEWDATITAPNAVAHNGLQATLSFPAPTSANAPWTYSINQTNITTNVAEAATLASDPVMLNDLVTATITGLTNGDDYTFTATIDTQYDGVSATSAASNVITAMFGPPVFVSAAIRSGGELTAATITEGS